MNFSAPWPPVAAGGSLVAMRPQDTLWREWLEGAPELLTAAGDGLQDLLTTRPAQTGALPAGFAEHLGREVEKVVQERAHRYAIRNNISALAEGRAMPVVTGQQPGFAGGPLYTLLKISSVVELARQMRGRGRPAVPVYWMGDDDDDLAEALSARVWLPGEPALLASGLRAAPGKGRDAMIGLLPAAELEGSWIRALREGRETAAPAWEDHLAAILAGNQTLAELTAATLWKLFGEDGLVILRGNDPQLHRHAAEFYRLVMPRLGSLREKAREGRRLAVKRFGCAPLVDNSLQRPLYQVHETHRRPLEQDTLPDDLSTLRCGVMLRSLLQDWLLGPAAVVVGPGELAYLTQLLPLYRELGLHRAPLLPRLFGWVVPEDVPAATLTEAAGDGPLDARQAADLADRAAEPSRTVLEHILEEMGLDSERSAALAAGRSRRWIKGVQSMLFAESRRLQDDRRAAFPPWIFPEGARQERRVAWAPLMAVWGESLLDSVRDAARLHWESGQAGHWREYLVRVPVDLLETKKGSPE